MSSVRTNGSVGVGGVNASHRSSIGGGAVMADGEILTLDSLENIQNSVEEVLQYCAANNLEIPEKLRQRLKKELAIPEDENVTKSAPPHVNTELKEGVASHQKFLNDLRLSSMRQSSMSEDTDSVKESIIDHALIQKVKKNSDILRAQMPLLDLRVKNAKYVATNHYEDDPNKQKKGYDEVNQDGEEGEQPRTRRAKQHIETVTSAGICFKWYRRIKRLVTKGQWQDYALDTTIIENVNLIFEPGKMVLMLGGPGSGKSTMLRFIADILPKGKDYQQSGEVTLSGISPSSESPKVHWPSLIGFMDQIDRLHPYLTVFETCEFAFRCRLAGTHKRPWQGSGPEIDQRIAEMDAEKSIVNLVLEALGLTRVKDTFVGDQEKVRGVSGGEKRRVTVAEMMCIGAPVLCCDEISTGLDGTYHERSTTWLAMHWINDCGILIHDSIRFTS
ncbi:Pleiotropic ABC efflux transporter of multiple drugs [Seminavis robusta]|uniref:Pleiotropic ABC efflux transporter of multiple drugs n=1 Tax=Seminavis robusta TaxID=568900 RepID=A0A9N8DDY9_9STRA|nr:Pleiotropic ABC efflux transporter of multiple drugs [Seminavis robusta]|eukprot:Sro28_g018730.1 Pleiotropic ABC efflux transporter of multiple drugs (445) ;mRNA; f:82916-84785